MSGVERIAAERRRQIEAEGYSPEHDAEHVNGQLARAAAVYAAPPTSRYSVPIWPWEVGDWKPGDRIRELEKAGALIAAEIDRLEALGQ